jgi:hypothetical protein
MGRVQLLREAEAAEQLAKMISFHPDKQRLLDLAARLRHEAATLEDRSWPAIPPTTPVRKSQRQPH